MAMPPMMAGSMEDAMPKKVTAVSVKVDKMKPMTFKPPKGWSSDNDDEVKEAVLKFKQNEDGTCEMISLDGAPFKGGKGEGEEPEATSDGTAGSAPEDTMEGAPPPDMPMEDSIKMLQKRDQKRY